MPFLYNWRLWRWGDQVCAGGLVTGHLNPSIQEGQEIHTSPIVKAEVAEGALRLFTASGSGYGLMPEAICSHREQAEETAQSLAAFGIGADFVEDCLRAREAAAARDAREESELLGPGELLVVTVGLNVLRGLFRAGDGTLTSVSPTVHLGMFQDSVLLTDWNGGAVDFRYFPRMDGRIEPYHISDGVETVKVKNLGRVSIPFGYREKTILCPPGEVTAIPAADYPYEGLFSPDVVNGKGLYNPKHQKKEDVCNDGE